jgi:hypothetical protein
MHSFSPPLRFAPSDCLFSPPDRVLFWCCVIGLAALRFPRVVILIPQLCLSPVACCCVRPLLHIGCWELGAGNTDTCTTPNYPILSYSILFVWSLGFFSPLSRSICRRGDTASTFLSCHILSLPARCGVSKYGIRARACVGEGVLTFLVSSLCYLCRHMCP